MKTLFVIILLVASAFTVQAQRCTVAAFYDGDGVTAQCGKRVVTFRVLAIDAPEKKDRSGRWVEQPYAQEATAELMAFIPVGTEIRVVPRGTSWNRTVAQIFKGKEDLGLHLVAKGAAHYLPGYGRKLGAARTEYAKATELAQMAKVGLWAGDPVEPSKWRKAKILTPEK
jgi:endonuclease YncB( thermonuclease family)